MMTGEQTLRVLTGRPYDVTARPGMLADAPALAERLAGLIPERAAIVTDTNVAPLYAAEVELALGSRLAGSVVIEAGEASKNPRELVRTLEAFAVMGLTRASAVIALGGGVVGDLAGLAAALWMRGVSCIQIPTTLLAMTDSSVGGKTAVDLPSGKNLMGAFAQPAAVLVDPETLRTLPERELSCGWGEIIKYAGISEGMHAHVLRALGLADGAAAPAAGAPVPHPDMALILEAIDVKRRIVEADEKEKGERRLLNLGHTVGHAVEAAARWELSHGACVGIGMAVLTRALVREGRLPSHMLETLEAMLARAGLWSRIPEHLAHRPDLDFSPEGLLAIARRDKKASSRGVALVLPAAPGQAVVEEVSWDALLQMIRLGLS